MLALTRVRFHLASGRPQGRVIPDISLQQAMAEIKGKVEDPLLQYAAQRLR
jgi:hypothetical protein